MNSFIELIYFEIIQWRNFIMIRSYKKGDDVKSIILSIDSDRERVSLGIKQLEQD